jgi:hypothetical protein
MTIAEIAVLGVLIASVVLSVWLGFFAPRVLIISSQTRVAGSGVRAIAPLACLPSESD